MNDFLLRMESTFKTDTDRITWLLLFTLVLILAGVTFWSKDPVTGSLVVVASSGVGALLGLLFSIPKRVAIPEQSAGTSQPAKGSLLIANTSLEEVSDWITKTIVGAGLVSWNVLLHRLDSAGLDVGQAIVGPVPAARACGVALILAAAVHGGICAYLWFSRYLPKEWQDAMDAALPRLEAQGLSQKGTDVAPTLATAGSPLAAAAVAAPEAPGEESRNQLQSIVAAKYARMRAEPLDVEDWALGMFGGESTVSNAFGRRSLTAEIAKAGKGIYKVTLTVTADPKPDGPCVFFLHNTFPNSTPSVGFDASGKASLTITAWGAFTVGALTDDGTTELELNLARVPGVPKEFVAAG